MLQSRTSLRPEARSIKALGLKRGDLGLVSGFKSHWEQAYQVGLDLTLSLLLREEQRIRGPTSLWISPILSEPNLTTSARAILNIHQYLESILFSFFLPYGHRILYCPLSRSQTTGKQKTTQSTGCNPNTIGMYCQYCNFSQLRSVVQ